MPKAKPEPDDKEQSKRFIEKAKEVSDKDSEKAFARTLKTVIPARQSLEREGDE